jgi:ribosome-binding factor A
VPREFERALRVGDQIQRELAALLEREARDQSFGLVTVSGVEVSRDLNYAKVYVSVLNPTCELAIIIAALNDSAGHLRHELSRRVRLRSVPRLHFLYDASISRGAQLSEMIDAAVASDELKHRDEHG